MKHSTSAYSRIKGIFCLLLALHFLNFSIDPRDVNPDSVPEDLSFNDIESFTEFLAEVVFNWAGAFPEHDERDSDEGGAIDFYKFYCYNQFVNIIQPKSSLSLSPKFHIRNSEKLLAPVKDIHSPPPRA